jgi:ATP-binding cassette, subfamily B, bacterial
MDSTAFARARRFLSYHPVAQSLAIASSILTAVLFFALIVLLALFVDLVVNRGEVPSLVQLSAAERQAFERTAMLPEDTDAAQTAKQRARETLLALKRPDADLRGWFAGEAVRELPYRERALLWYVAAIQHVHDTVGEEAGARLAERLRSNLEEARELAPAVSRPIADLGLLSRVIRSRGTVAGWLAGQLAGWNDWTWTGGDATYLVGLFLLASGVAAVRFALLFAANYAAAVTCLEAVLRLRRAVYLHSHRLSALAFQPHGASDAVGVSNHDLELVHEALYRWLTVVFREPVKAVLLLVFALLISPWLAVAIFMFALLVWMVGGQIAMVLRREGRAAQHEAGKQVALIQESLTLTRLVKVTLMEAFNQARVDRQLRAYTRAQLARYRYAAIYRPLFAFLGLVATLVLLFAAGYVVVQGHVGVVSVAVLAAALVCLYWPVRALLDTRRTLRRGRAAADALFAFLDRQGGVGQAIEAEFLPALAKSLELDKVTVLDPGGDGKLLRNVSLRIEAGQRVALVGPDALEKQALLALLPRFIDPSAGEVRIDGKSLRWVTLDSLRAQIGLVLQHNLVFSDTVANNIGCGDPAYNLQRIIEAAKTAHAHQFIQNLPQGYETVVGSAGHELGPGEMFRIALARVILREPALFIIEEPPVTLDDGTKALIDDTMQRILPGRTAIFLPSRLSTIRNCDQVFLLHQGRIIASGDHRELLATCDLYKHLQYMQFNEFAGTVGNHPPAPVAEETRP